MNALLFKIFVWSIVLEPMLFFVAGSRTMTGVTANVSRILQAIVILCLVVRCVGASAPTHLLKPTSRLYWNYFLYFVFACVAGVYGAATGAFSVGVGYNVDVGGVASILNAAWARPVFEYVIAFYYFLYFVVLPQFFLYDDARLGYFFRIFFLMFGISLVAGYIDLLFSPPDYPLIGRHIGDWISVGRRFHGFAGEPRDAFVYLMLGITLQYLRCYWTGQRMSRKWLWAVSAAAVLTQSASGLLGMAIFLGLLVAVAVVRLNKRVLVLALLTVLILPPVLYGVIQSSERLIAYKEALLLVWDLLERQRDMPLVLLGQLNNIYPIYSLINKARELDLLPIFIGSGLGSASVLNNAMGTYGEVANPNAQLIRLMYESGLIGLALFIMAFYRPIEHLTASVDPRRRRVFLMLTLLLLGSFLAHRHSALFIFSGIAIATFRVMAAARGSRTVVAHARPRADVGGLTPAPAAT